ncbi:MULTISPECIES: tautomerase family protein [unclassified Nocardia]|uniref:tautomerase family protein n=1 Tax=unclassified Nocardia TaxID=2637762 RepID=UPI002E210DBF
MPMLDAFIPEGALSEDAERQLIAKLTDILLLHEGADPQNPAARSIAWVFLHRPAAVYVAGEPADAPRYRFIPSVPQGQFDDERRRAIVAAVTDAVLDAEDGAYPRNPLRVWVFPNEIPDGTWGGGGRIFTLADIAGFVTGDPEKGRAYAEWRLASAR